MAILKSLRTNQIRTAPSEPKRPARSCEFFLKIETKYREKTRIHIHVLYSCAVSLGNVIAPDSAKREWHETNCSVRRSVVRRKNERTSYDNVVAPIEYVDEREFGEIFNDARKILRQKDVFACWARSNSLQFFWREIGHCTVPTPTYLYVLCRRAVVHARFE